MEPGAVRIRTRLRSPCAGRRYHISRCHRICRDQLGRADCRSQFALPQILLHERTKDGIPSLFFKKTSSSLVIVFRPAILIIGALPVGSRGRGIRLAPRRTLLGTLRRRPAFRGLPVGLRIVNVRISGTGLHATFVRLARTCLVSAVRRRLLVLTRRCNRCGRSARFIAIRGCG